MPDRARPGQSIMSKHERTELARQAPAGARLSGEEHALLTSALAAFPDGVPRGHVLCAVSGGSDSVALLELLTIARSRSPFELSAAYVDHGLRASAADEREHVRRLAAERGLGFASERLADPGAGDENHLRSRRYQLLDRIATRVGAASIATGHTRDDQIETILFRLLRGSGRLGLSGIPRRRGKLVRPLLDIESARLRGFLEARGVTWMEDASNRDGRYARNRIRNDVIPTIERALGRAGLKRLPERAARWREEEAFLQAQAARWQAFAVREASEDGPVIDIAALDAAPAALRARVLRAWLERVTGGREVSLARLAALEALAATRGGSGSVDVAGITVTREYGRVRVAGRHAAGAFEHVVRPERADRIEGPGRAWVLAVDPQPAGSPRGAASVYFHELDVDLDGLPESLLLRPVAAGDVLETAERGTRKVRAIMQDRHVPLRLRESWPVLVDRERVLWVPGVARAGSLAGAERAQRRVRFAWYLRHR